MVDQQPKNKFDNDDFFEDLDIIGSNKYESLDYDFEADTSAGLSQENVYKLTEDLQNPLPPSEN